VGIPQSGTAQAISRYSSPSWTPSCHLGKAKRAIVGGVVGIREGVLNQLVNSMLDRVQALIAAGAGTQNSENYRSAVSMIRTASCRK